MLYIYYIHLYSKSSAKLSSQFYLCLWTIHHRIVIIQAESHKRGFDWRSHPHNRKRGYLNTLKVLHSFPIHRPSWTSSTELDPRLNQIFVSICLLTLKYLSTFLNESHLWWLKHPFIVQGSSLSGAQTVNSIVVRLWCTPVGYQRQIDRKPPLLSATPR